MSLSRTTLEVENRFESFLWKAIQQLSNCLSSRPQIASNEHLAVFSDLGRLFFWRERASEH